MSKISHPILESELTIDWTLFSLPGIGVAEMIDRVRLVDGEGLVLAVGHAREGGERLALASGAQDDDLVVGDAVDVVGVDDVLLVDGEVAELAGDLGVGDAWSGP